MIVSAALVPSAPLLVPELGGAHPPLAELRSAATRAVAVMLEELPDLVAVVGPAGSTAVHPPDTPVDFGPFLGTATTGRAALPLALALGARLLHDAGHTGGTAFQAVAVDAAREACTALGRSLADGTGRVALLVVGDGSARRTPKAPGWFDERAEAFDAATERAVGSGELAALLDVEPTLATTLQAAGRPAWQVMAGAAGDRGCVSELHYADAPLGVGYLVAAVRFGHDLQPSRPGLT
jgi:hypothetical protein